MPHNEIKWFEARLNDLDEADANDDVDGMGQAELRDRTIWFRAEESGDPDAVARFVQHVGCISMHLRQNARGIKPAPAGTQEAAWDNEEGASRCTLPG